MLTHLLAAAVGCAIGVVMPAAMKKWRDRPKIPKEVLRQWRVRRRQEKKWKPHQICGMQCLYGDYCPEVYFTDGRVRCHAMDERGERDLD